MDKYKTSNFEVGLTKVMGCNIKEVHGYVSNEFDEPTFKLTKIELMDGTNITCEGEHDCPYLAYNDKLDEKCKEIHDDENKA